MSLEQAIKDLTEAVAKNTAALTVGGGKSTASSDKKETKASAHTRAEMQAALQEVSSKKSKDTAKKVIKEVGGVEKMGEIPDDKIDKVYDAAKKALAEADDDM